MAKLTFYYGTMSSGKTIDLIQTAYKYNSNGMKAVLMKPKVDTKGNDKVVSRIGLEKQVDIVLDVQESIFDYRNILEDVTCLLVDEAQFLTERQIYELFLLTKDYDIPVICYGLRTDFQGKLFEGSKTLFALADNLEKLRAVCATPKCGNNASFNARKVNGKYVYDGQQILIGEDESYDPLCNKCYLEKVLKPYSKDFQKIIKLEKNME